MRWLPVSATSIFNPSWSRVIPRGDENSPVPLPCRPNAKLKVPLGWNTWMRWLPVSATSIRPSLYMNMPRGDENSPVPLPAALAGASDGGGGMDWA